MENGHIKQVALFIDLDNFIGSCLNYGLKRDLSNDIKTLEQHGRVVIRRSYGDMYKIPMPPLDKENIRRMLQENLVQHEDVRHRTSYKNSSDIKLVIETLAVAYTNPTISTFAVVADDRDYVPLFSKLRELGKTVIIIGGSEESVDNYYRSSCDHIYYHSQIAGAEMPIPPEEAEELKAAFHKIPLEVEDEAIVLLIEAVKAAEDQRKYPLGSVLTPIMKQFKPDLDFSDYNVSGFQGVAELAMKRGFVSITRHGLDILVSCNDAVIEDYFICVTE